MRFEGVLSWDSNGNGMRFEGVLRWDSNGNGLAHLMLFETC